MTAPTLGEHQLPISAQDVPYRAEDRTLFASSAAGLRSGGNDAAHQTAQRQRLKPDAAGPAKRIKMVMNSDSPMRSRFPAPISASTKLLCSAEPSPNTVSMLMPSSM